MEAILKFNLKDEDDVASHMRCVKSDDMAFVLFDLLYKTKKKVEHIIELAEDRNETMDAHDGMELMYQEIYGLLEKYNVDVDELLT
jgi:hypothetical protein